MIRTYRFRLYPTPAQEVVMSDVVETCRRVYNEFLHDRMKNGTDFAKQRHELSKRRREDKYLKQVHSQVLQDVSWRIQKAFHAFFKGKSGHPKFKRNGKYTSFTYPQEGRFFVVDGRLHLSMMGKVRIRLHRTILGQVKTCTIHRSVDQWYACFAVDVEPEDSPHYAEPASAVGVDLGITSAVALSDGTKVPGPRFLKTSKVRIVALQRSVSRKMIGSKNRDKAKTKLAKAWRRVVNKRIDFAYKTSRYLVDNYNPIVFESLAVPKMFKNHKLAPAIMDACWGKLRLLTAAKAERRNRRVILVEPRGTSQKCSGCGQRQDTTLGMRVFSCQKCGLVLDRDVNAARNVLAMGLEQAQVEAEPIPSMGAGKFGRGSKKPIVQRRGQFTTAFYHSQSHRQMRI